MTPPAAAAAPAVRPRRPTAPRGPRRVSGPARPRVAPSPARTRTTGRDAGLLLGLISALEGLAQHRLLDRLIRGRTCIAIVAFALIGIVTLQLGLLKLNGGIGHALEREALLQSQNAALSIENSELAAGQRVEARAGHLGMAFTPSGSLHFLSATSHGAVAKAAAALGSAARASAMQASEAKAAAAGESQGRSEASSAEAGSSGGEASATQASGESSAEAGAAGSESADSESEVSSSSAAASAATGESSGETQAPSDATASSGAASEAEPSGGSSAESAGG
jgi:hypothetical protein